MRIAFFDDLRRVLGLLSKRQRNTLKRTKREIDPFWREIRVSVVYLHGRRKEPTLFSIIDNR